METEASLQKASWCGISREGLFQAPVQNVRVSDNGWDVSLARWKSCLTAGVGVVCIILEIKKENAHNSDLTSLQLMVTPSGLASIVHHGQTGC